MNDRDQRDELLNLLHAMRPDVYTFLVEHVRFVHAHAEIYQEWRKKQQEKLQWSGIERRKNRIDRRKLPT